MPLISSKSPEAFKENLKSELGAGKPMKQSLAIAYAMRKRKMAKGGMIEGTNENEESHAESEMAGDRPSQIVESIMKARKAKGDYGSGPRYAEGGMVMGDNDSEVSHDADSKEMEAMSHSGDLFLTGEHDMGPEYDGMEKPVPEEDEKKMMSRLMNEVRMRHMGR